MIRSQNPGRRLLYPKKQWLGFGVTLLTIVQNGQIISRDNRISIAPAKDTFTRLKHTKVNRFGIGITSLPTIAKCQIVEDTKGVGMIRARYTLPNFQNLQQQGLSLCHPSDHAVECR